MAKIAKDGSILAHRFEAAGLGLAPYKLLGMTEEVITYPNGTTQAAGTCDLCYTGIRYVYSIKSSDGKTFKVGCDCVKYLGDSKLVAMVESAERKRKARAKAAKLEAQYDELVPVYRQSLTTLAALPHPNAHFAGQGKTLADYYTFLEDVNGKASFISRMREAIKKASKI